MPFVRQEFFIKEPTKAIEFIKNLGFDTKQAQRILDKARLRLDTNTPIYKSQIIQGRVYLTHFNPRFYKEDELIKPLIKTPDFAIFNKPAKLLTHPKGSFLHKSLLDSINFHLGREAKPIHRLDYETSGLILVGKGAENERNLKDLFMHQGIKKKYLAQVFGCIKKPLIINAPILSPNREDKKLKNLSIRSKISPKGKSAITKITPIKHIKNIALLDSYTNRAFLDSKDFAQDKFSDFQDSTLLKVEPLTGRTHQIRIHLSHIKHPILNDFLYGCADDVSECYLDEMQEGFLQESKAQDLENFNDSNLEAKNLTQPLESKKQHSQNLDSKIPQNQTLKTTKKSSQIKYANKILHLHSYYLGFCYKGVRYSFYAPHPQWWQDA